MSGKEIKFKYYVEIESKEHMLYNKEIALEYGIYTKNNVPHARLVGVIIDKYKKEHGIKERYHFKNRFGLSEVTPMSVYHPALTEFKIMCQGRSEAVVNGTKYNFIIKS